MTASIFDNTTIPALQQVVAFAEARHNVLASNIANLDTPGYRVRDLSPEEFEARLKEALDDASLSTTDTEIQPEPDFTAVRETMESILFHDDSNVSIEHQVAELSKNQMMHNMALSIMRSQFDLLQAAISEQA